MAARVAQLAVALLLLAGDHRPTSRSRESVAIQRFKAFALSSCIADGFPSSEEVAKEASAAAGGYLELGELPLEAHTEATRLAREALAKDYRSISGAKLTLMKCIDFHDGPALDQLARRYAARR